MQKIGSGFVLEFSNSAYLSDISSTSVAWNPVFKVAKNLTIINTINKITK